MRYEIGQVNRLGNRPSNQDRFAAIENDHGILLVLADGMGGYHRGELAAELLVESARTAFHDRTTPIGDPDTFLTQVIHACHSAILTAWRERSLSQIPGTTGVLCLVQQGMAYWAHVGDSRLYLFRQGLPLYRTRDHSAVERLYRKGAIHYSDKGRHPLRNQVTQCIGCLKDLPKAELGKPMPLAENDIIVLCSDGLWSGLDDAQMGTMLQRGTLDESANLMAEMAERNTYPRSDNISLLALKVLALETDEASRGDSSRVPPLTGGKEQLQEAIDQIEEIIKKYEGEMNR